MKRLTYWAVGDALRKPHYCAAPGVKKDDLVQRLGVFEDGQSCVGCRHYHNGDGDDTVCPGCCRNYEEDCYES
ncbi:MAG: hypothetical protein IJO75_01780 [Clostridia bacterium]|nr:hypothetical protein [Clostridia bacterium]